MSAPRPYQVVLYVGPDTPTVPDTRVVNLTPPAATADSVLDTLLQSGIGPSDLRARVLFLADGTGSESRDAALLTYAALLGFSKRRLDVAFTAGGPSFDMSEVDQTLRKLPDAGRFEQAPLAVQIGGPERDDITFVDLAGGFTPKAVSAIRYARRARFVPPDVIGHALPQLVAIAALRSRGPLDKLPYLCDGSEPAPTADTVTDIVGVCLDTLRRSAETLRRSQRTDNRDALAERPESTARLARLSAADDAPLVDILHRLGATSTVAEIDARPGTPEFEAGTRVTVELWHCPRPGRHTNGDATPSARISKAGGFQCFRCDRERVKALRLVMDTLDMTPDEAADWILPRS